MLIQLDQLIEQLRILPFQSMSDRRIFALDLYSLGSCKRDGASVHSVRDDLSAREVSPFG
jgi:hypothetical protein